MATSEHPTYYRGGPSLRSTLTWIGAVCGALAALATVAGYGKSYLDAHYVARSAFERFTHDDTLRHQFADRVRVRTAFLIDSIEQAHQPHGTGRVLQAGEPRP